MVAALGLAAATATAPAAPAAAAPAPAPALVNAAAPAAAGQAAAARSATHVGVNPENTVLDPATHTLYVVSSVISVLNAATCNARTHTSCGAIPERINVGGGAGAAIDEATRTLYVAEPGANSVAVIDIATCNAIDHSGCGSPVHTVAAGSVPVAVDVDQATDTVYAPDWGNGTGTTVSVIDGATCNGRTTSGCGQIPETVTTGIGPNGLIVDQRTDTVYAPMVAPNGAERVAVINGATCNSRTTAGCGQTPRTVRVGNGSSNDGVGVAIDQQQRTLYLTNVVDQTLSMIDTVTCNGTHGAGCARRPAVVRVGVSPNAVTIDPATQTVYVPNGDDADLSVLNAATCNAHRTVGCAAGDQREIRTGLGPSDVTLDADSGTLYVPNQESNTVSVLDAATCNATHSSGCTPYPVTVDLGLRSAPFGFALDPATHSLYVADSGDTQAGTTVSVINANGCRVGRTAGCGRTPPTTTVGTNPNEAAFDPATHTVYVSNYVSNTVSVINTAACNALHPAGCRRRTSTIKVPGGPFGIAVDVASDTVYVTGVNNGDMSIINGATCNATHHTVCGQRPRQIPVGANARGVAVDPATHTVYVTAFGKFGGTPLHTMSVFDAATCNARVASGCAHPQRVGVGTNPWGIAIDEATDTVYVVDDNGFSGRGAVTVIDGALCNATHHGRCGRNAPTVAVGTVPLVPSVDPATGWLYVPNQADATVSVIDGATCNAVKHASCARGAGTVFVDGSPSEVLVDDATGTVYVSHYSGVVSVLRAHR